MPKSIELSDMEKDALKETSNIGAGNASIALSEVVNKKVNLVVSDVSLANLEDISTLLAGPQRLVVGIYTPIKTGMSGNVLMMLEKEAALGLADEILSLKERSDDVLTKKDEEGLKTVGNLISEYYVKSLNDFLGLKMGFDETNIITTFGESIIDIIMMSIDPDAKEVLLINTDFGIEDSEIKGHFALLLAIKDIDVLLEGLRKNFV